MVTLVFEMLCVCPDTHPFVVSPHLPPAVSHSDGRLKSPTDSVFLHMEGIPHIQEELALGTESDTQQSEYSKDTLRMQVSEQEGCLRD